MNKKGQALVEFIIILPVFLYMILALIDYSLIVYNKNRMENVIGDVVNMYKKNETSNEIEKFVKNEVDSNIEMNVKDKYLDIKLNKKYKFIAPGLTTIFGKDYLISVERNIYNEQ